MKCLGIDYGTKRIGVAVSDDTGSVAFPLTTIASDRGALDATIALIKENNVETIVIGESRNFQNEPNPVMEDIEQFKNDIAELTGLPVEYEREFMTSTQAARQFTPGRLPAGRQGSRKEAPSQAKLDASAAALILQGYLDRNRKTS
ncbi:MAG TPA: Holliday junction resolvase RuvX [Candidatus Paceibacterota bacterium]|nr:Holliday junction resolvase RuvX [Candidatus Paceibacterota bacterium]